ncbi:hypothetical protein WJX72_010573 [[Myrmecia] bisecta]|uniref:Uncharacterized protein n=1 Tax=[Myrmecia] bisecta TaxID=41462 RepID=A0AAW1PI20_9CHLO
MHRVFQSPNGATALGGTSSLTEGAGQYGLPESGDLTTASPKPQQSEQDDHRQQLIALCKQLVSLDSAQQAAQARLDQLHTAAAQPTSTQATLREKQQRLHDEHTKQQDLLRRTEVEATLAEAAYNTACEAYTKLNEQPTDFDVQRLEELTRALDSIRAARQEKEEKEAALVVVESQASACVEAVGRAQAELQAEKQRQEQEEAAACQAVQPTWVQTLLLRRHRHPRQGLPHPHNQLAMPRVQTLLLRGHRHLGQGLPRPLNQPAVPRSMQRQHLLDWQSRSSVNHSPLPFSLPHRLPLLQLWSQLKVK